MFALFAVTTSLYVSAAEAATFIGRMLAVAAEESALHLLSPLCEPGDCPELDQLCQACRIYGETFDDDGFQPFYVALLQALECRPVECFYPSPIVDGPWLVGDGIDLWSAPCEAVALLVAAAIDPITDPYVEHFADCAPCVE